MERENEEWESGKEGDQNETKRKERHERIRMGEGVGDGWGE